MIKVQNLSKFYGPTQAVNSISFSVEKGEVVGFLGPNGAGKSTTMKILTGAMPASDGEVTICGYDLFKDPIEVKKRVGYLPETPPLYPEMSVRDYLTFAAKLHGLTNRDERHKAVDEAMEKTKISDVSHRLIRNLSKGYRQRVGLAQAISHNPDVLVLDEPTVGLDPRQIIEIRDLIRSLAGQHTVILSSHILPEVAATCERAIVINRGHIVADESLRKFGTGSAGTHLEVLIRGADSQLEQVFSEHSAIQSVKVSPLDGVTRFELDLKEGQDPRSEIASLVISRNIELLELRSKGTSLEDIFLRLTSTDISSQEQAI